MISREPLVPDRAIIELCDSDAKWGPLLFLRPQPDQRLTLFRIAALALIPAALFGALGSLALDLAARTFEQPPVPWYSFPATLLGLYFAACSLLVAPPWNRRAARLARISRYRDR
jgi:hypothetical protein